LKAPRILLFDEATSALDSNTEEGVLEALHELAQGRTTLMVAHRLSTAAQCDKIAVIEDGVVVESGKITFNTTFKIYILIHLNYKFVLKEHIQSCSVELGDMLNFGKSRGLGSLMFKYGNF
jgi:ABC-type multidrug transport system ATPase subunit